MAESQSAERSGSLEVAEKEPSVFFGIMRIFSHVSRFCLQAVQVHHGTDEPCLACMHVTQQISATASC